MSTEEANTLEIMENTMSEEEDKDEELEEDEDINGFIGFLIQ